MASEAGLVDYPVDVPGRISDLRAQGLTFHYRVADGAAGWAPELALSGATDAVDVPARAWLKANKAAVVAYCHSAHLDAVRRNVATSADAGRLPATAVPESSLPAVRAAGAGHPARFRVGQLVVPDVAYPNTWPGRGWPRKVARILVTTDGESVYRLARDGTRLWAESGLVRWTPGTPLTAPRAPESVVAPTSGADDDPESETDVRQHADVVTPDSLPAADAPPDTVADTMPPVVTLTQVGETIAVDWGERRVPLTAEDPRPDLLEDTPWWRILLTWARRSEPVDAPPPQGLYACLHQLRANGARLRALKAGVRKRVALSDGDTYAGGRERFERHSGEVEAYYGWVLAPFLTALGDLLSAAGADALSLALGGPPPPRPRATRRAVPGDSGRP